MFGFRIAPLLLIGLVFSPVEDDKSALERDPRGWTDLLANAGPELKGWSRETIPPKGTRNPKSQWSIDKATVTLVCDGDGGHEWLRWDEDLKDFVFHVEWKFTKVEGKKGYNSGVYARNSANARVWHQAQTGDKSGGFLFGETLVNETLSRFNFSGKVKESRVRPAGEWNTYEITAKGPNMTLWTNGAVTCEWPDCQIPSGYVGLEAEGYRIEFRNVKIKPL